MEKITLDKKITVISCVHPETGKFGRDQGLGKI